MKQLTDGERLFLKEGRGRFNLRKSLHTVPTNPLDNRSGRGPTHKGTTRPVVQGDQSDVLPRVKMVPKLVKDANGVEVRAFVPYRRKRNG